LSAAAQMLNFTLAQQRLSLSSAKTLLTTQPSLQNNSSVAQLSLEPFAVYIAALKK
jgi:hypothetical protein